MKHHFWNHEMFLRQSIPSRTSMKFPTIPHDAEYTYTDLTVEPPVTYVYNKKHVLQLVYCDGKKLDLKVPSHMQKVINDHQANNKAKG